MELTNGLETTLGYLQRARSYAQLRAILQLPVRYVPGIPVCLPVGTADYNSDGIPDCGNVSAATPSSEKAATNAALSAEKISLSFPADPVVVGTT